MKQHVISEWLLRDLAQATKSGLRLATYAKSTDTFGSERPADFMARFDSHAVAVEGQLGRIESPAARAARKLVAKVLDGPPGIARVTAREEPAPVSTSQAGTTGGFQLVIAHRGIAVLNDRERAALGKFMTLMFTRSPKVERSINRIGDVYYTHARAAISRARLAAPIRTASEAEVEAVSKNAALRAINHVGRIGGFIADLHWWVLRTEGEERFVLGDTPTAAAVALGHAEAFLPLLGSSTFVLTMPLHPEVALLATPMPVLPVAGPSSDLVGAVNRLSWLWAEDYVLANDEQTLQETYRQLAPEERRRTITVPFDQEALRIVAIGDVSSVLVAAEWRPLGPNRCLEGQLQGLTFVPGRR